MSNVTEKVVLGQRKEASKAGGVKRLSCHAMKRAQPDIHEMASATFVSPRKSCCNYSLICKNLLVSQIYSMLTPCYI